MGPNFIDEIDCGSFFDYIDDLIVCPQENESGDLGAGDCKDFPIICKDNLPDNDSILPCNDRNPGSDLSTELAMPYEEILQLEWLSTFVEDSFAEGGLTMARDESSVNKEPSLNQFRTSSPVSVLESSSSSSSSSSCIGGITIPLSPSHRGTQRPRSKRPRPATFNPHTSTQLVWSASSFTETPQPFEAPGSFGQSENFAESHPVGNDTDKPSGPEQKKKKKLKLKFSSAPPEVNQNPPAQAVRKCLHCEITKTPQWRAGPMGPKTLCNACGVRFKSGRLFPEYRPAASPTFVPSLHSNSHKKVVEMRNKSVEKGSIAGHVVTAPTTTQPVLIPNTSTSLDYSTAADPRLVPSLDFNSDNKVYEARSKSIEKGNSAGSVVTTPTTTQPELIPNTSSSLE